MGIGMRYDKKFQEVGGTKMIIIPAQWINAQEKQHGKKMLGVYLEVNSEMIEVTPMWEEAT